MKAKLNDDQSRLKLRNKGICGGDREEQAKWCDRDGRPPRARSPQEWFAIRFVFLDRSWGDVLIWRQELGSMYDYLAKIILLGPSGSGKYAVFFLFVWQATDEQQVVFASPICEG